MDIVSPSVLSRQSSVIYAMAFSPSGVWLAGCGTDGCKIWSKETHKLVGVPRARGLRGPVSAVDWVADEDHEKVYFGTGLGILIGWKAKDETFTETICERVGNGEEITVIMGDSSSGRLYAGTRDGLVLAWTAGSDSLVSIFQVSVDGSVPTALAITDTATANILVFGIYLGVRHTLSGQDGHILSTEHTDIVMGQTAVSTRNNIYVCDNGIDGFDIYNLDSNYHLGHLPTPPVAIAVPKQIAIINHDKFVITGSDHGLVYVFERKTGKVLDRFRHSADGLVQTIAVHENESEILIASASSSLQKDMRVMLWTCQNVEASPVTSNKPVAPRSRTNLARNVFDVVTRVVTGAVTVYWAYLTLRDDIGKVTEYWDRLCTLATELVASVRLG